MSEFMIIFLWMLAIAGSIYTSYRIAAWKWLDNHKLIFVLVIVMAALFWSEVVVWIARLGSIR